MSWSLIAFVIGCWCVIWWLVGLIVTFSSHAQLKDNVVYILAAPLLPCAVPVLLILAILSPIVFNWSFKIPAKRIVAQLKNQGIKVKRHEFHALRNGIDSSPPYWNMTLDGKPSDATLVACRDVFLKAREIYQVAYLYDIVIHFDHEFNLGIPLIVTREMRHKAVCGEGGFYEGMDRIFGSEVVGKICCSYTAQGCAETEYFLGLRNEVWNSASIDSDGKIEKWYSGECFACRKERQQKSQS